MTVEKMFMSEILDSPKSLKEFMSMNGIRQKDIDKIIIIWGEDVEVSK